MEKEQREAIISHFVHVHLRIPEKSEELKKKTGRINYSTPKNYLDFLDNFKKIYDESSSLNK
jgi:hypothetical protein